MLFFNEVQYIQGEQQPGQPEQPDQRQGTEGDMGEREAEVTEQQNTVRIKATTGEEVTIVPINLRDNIVRVRCDCLDFYYRFAPWNFSNDDIYGPKPKPYVRKTNHYPPANPSRSPGICKHVMKLAQACQEAGIVRR
jgi:hypothetical protein